MSNFFEKIRKTYPATKRVLDIVISAILLLVLLPVMVIAYIAVITTSKGPGLFWSKRTGQNGVGFMMPKLRTMTICSKVLSREVASADDVKVTKVGKFLRRTSIDELPQLWSVFIGNMSLVGPRPILEYDIAFYERNSRPAIYRVKPGITGLAQISGRNFVSPRNKSKYDEFYSDRLCVLLDIKILMKTFKAVIKPDIIL